MPLALNKISTVALWLCMLITLVLSIGFFWVYFTQQTIGRESAEVSALLSWLFSLLILTVSTGLIFSLFSFIRQWKDNPQKVKRSLIIMFVWGFLLLIAWMLGNGNPLPLIGYKGNENTYFWLKLTDMWLYSIYILMGIAFISLFGGIIWSYFKKLK